MKKNNNLSKNKIIKKKPVKKTPVKKTPVKKTTTQLKQKQERSVDVKVNIDQSKKTTTQTRQPPRPPQYVPSISFSPSISTPSSSPYSLSDVRDTVRSLLGEAIKNKESSAPRTIEEEPKNIYDMKIPEKNIESKLPESIPMITEKKIPSKIKEEIIPEETLSSILQPISKPESIAESISSLPEETMSKKEKRKEAQKKYYEKKKEEKFSLYDPLYLGTFNKADLKNQAEELGIETKKKSKEQLINDISSQAIKKNKII
jgi:hypothetical protein